MAAPTLVQCLATSNVWLSSPIMFSNGIVSESVSLAPTAITDNSFGQLIKDLVSSKEAP
jgi:hypothetical protein